MKREQMITEIQKQEAALFLKIKLVERDFGRASDLYTMARSEWKAVSCLMETLGIEPDMDAPEVAQALRVMATIE
jgi:chromosome condensin MukBEF ATPase and DNA-binding subunit MukB